MVRVLLSLVGLLLASGIALLILGIEGGEDLVRASQRSATSPIRETGPSTEQGEKAVPPLRIPESGRAPRKKVSGFAATPEWTAFLAAARSGEVEAARKSAAALRALLRKDAALRNQAFAKLADTDFDLQFRMALLLVLATLPNPGVDASLCEALGPPPVDPALAPWLLLALGASRSSPDRDEIFDMGDQPWGEPGPFGLGITIRREIADPRTRSVLMGRLRSSGNPDERRAAAIALRHSLADPLVRDSFLSALGTEGEDRVAAPLGEALAQTYREEGGKDPRIPALLIRRARDPSLPVFRFQILDELRGLPLAAPQRRDLAGLAKARAPAEARRFALEVLTDARNSPEERKEVGGLLLDLMRKDRDALVRDQAARLLRRLPPGKEIDRWLESSARTDPAWNVRWSALDSLLSRRGPTALRPLLRRAAKDRDLRVRARARQALRIAFDRR